MIERGAGGLPGSLAFLNGQIDGYKVKNGFGGDISPGFEENIFLGSSITPPPEDLYNNNSNFDLTNAFYSVPSVGNYSFGAFIKGFLLSTPTFIQAILTVRIERTDSSNVFIEDLFNESYTYDVQSDNVDVELDIQSDVFFLNATDRVRVLVGLTLGIGPGTTLFTHPSNQSFNFSLSTEAGGGIYKTFDVQTTRILTNQFTFWLSDEDYQTIKNNITKRIGFTNPRFNNGGWIQRLSWKPVKKQASFNLINYGI